jgi:hypothetical protein
MNQKTYIKAKIHKGKEWTRRALTLNHFLLMIQLDIHNYHVVFDLVLLILSKTLQVALW